MLLAPSRLPSAFVWSATVFWIPLYSLCGGFELQDGPKRLRNGLKTCQIGPNMVDKMAPSASDRQKHRNLKICTPSRRHARFRGPAFCVWVLSQCCYRRPLRSKTSIFRRRHFRSRHLAPVGRCSNSLRSFSTVHSNANILRLQGCQRLRGCYLRMCGLS